MGRFFTRERFGRPQVLAGTLLLIFLAQCAWLVNRSRSVMPEAHEIFRIHEGLGQWRGQWIASTPSVARTQQSVGDEPYDSHHSALWYLIASAPSLLLPRNTANYPYWGWLAHTPYLIFGVLLGASLWYVSRRLYGNAGGYIALTLYCFSPGIIRGSALGFTHLEIAAAWGAFGTIFTAIAVAHTLYAPREVVLWNWRRILLLGLSLPLAVGTQFSLVITIPAALAFMLYLAPARRAAAFAIWVASCAIAFVLLFASYSFRPGVFWEGIRHATLLGINWRVFARPGAYRQVLSHLGQMSPALALALPVAVITYVVWPRTRYFGNTAPLLVAGLCVLLGLATPHYPGFGFELIAVPFLFVFVAGVAADLLETPMRSLVIAFLVGLLGAYALWCLLELARVARA